MRGWPCRETTTPPNRAARVPKRWPGVFAKSPLPTAIWHRQSRRLHRLHPLALPARKHAAGPGQGMGSEHPRPLRRHHQRRHPPRPGRPHGRGGRIPAHAGHRPALLRQHPQPAKQLGHDGAEDRAAGPVLRRQRHGQRDDGGKRRQRRRHHLPPERARNLPADPRRRLDPRPARPVLQRLSTPRRPDSPDLAPPTSARCGTSARSTRLHRPRPRPRRRPGPKRQSATPHPQRQKSNISPRGDLSESPPQNFGHSVNHTRSYPLSRYAGLL